MKLLEDIKKALEEECSKITYKFEPDNIDTATGVAKLTGYYQKYLDDYVNRYPEECRAFLNERGYFGDYLSVSFTISDDKEPIVVKSKLPEEYCNDIERVILNVETALENSFKENGTDIKAIPDENIMNYLDNTLTLENNLKLQGVDVNEQK